MGVGDWPGSISAAVAVGSAIVAAASAWRSRRAKAEATRQPEQAVKAAEDSASAAGRSAGAAERSAAAEETRANLASEQAVADERSPWEIVAIPGSKNCQLQNKTSTRKYGVRVAGKAVRQSHVGTIDGNGVAEIDTLLSVWGLDRKVTVTWNRKQDLSDEPLSWNSDLPPKIK